jgi:hypothetical protein
VYFLGIVVCPFVFPAREKICSFLTFIFQGEKRALFLFFVLFCFLPFLPFLPLKKMSIFPPDAATRLVSTFSIPPLNSSSISPHPDTLPVPQ